MIDDERIVAGILQSVLAAAVEHLTKHQRPPGLVVHGIVLWLLSKPSLEAVQHIVPAASAGPLSEAPDERALRPTHPYAGPRSELIDHLVPRSEYLVALS